MSSALQAVTLSLCLSTGALAAVQLPGTNHGTDGAFNPTTNTVVDLRKAQSGAGITWESPGGDTDLDGFGDGVYDGEQWAVVFKYTSVNIPAGVTVTFINHDPNAPVVWLVQGDVTISGTVSLNGVDGHNQGQLRTNALGGPGGFRGGRGSDDSSNASAGFGPGGARSANGPRGGSGGGYTAGGSNAINDSGRAGVSYGNKGVFPLIGGSGGAGGENGIYGAGGGGGGGAFLIATTSQLVLNQGAKVTANGGKGPNNPNTSNNRGGGGGSGGTIRLLADQLSGAGVLQARYGTIDVVHSYGGYGSNGRIRIEANDTSSLTNQGDPIASFGLPGEMARIWPDDLTPRVRGARLVDQDVPTDPRASLNFPEADVQLLDGQGATLEIQAENVPVDGTWSMSVRVIRASGSDGLVTLTNTSATGDIASSTWTTPVTLSDGFSNIQVRAYKNP